VSDYEREARHKRVRALREAGIDPYPARVGPRQRVAEVLARWGGADAASLESEAPRVAVAGRLLAKRSFGKLLFFNLVEDGAAIQVSARKSEIEAELFEFSKALDVGDIVRVEGVLWRTRTGELTVDARAVQMLAKSLAPLPEKWHGLTDVEARFRHRHLDLLCNQEVRRTALLRSRVVSAMRAFLDARGFVEVETPILQPLYGGASARPFSTHHNLYDQDLYLRISDELYLKRLVIGGLDRVYEIGRDFRNEGVSRKHNPEFTMMECYQAYADYRDTMDLMEAMLREIAERALGTTRFPCQGEEIDLARPWRRVTLHDAIEDATGIDILAAGDLPALRAAVGASDLALESQASPSWAVLVDEIFSAAVEPDLLQPTFVTDHPVELSPLAKRSAERPRLVERFEAFIGGIELANAFSELNDPIDQRERFEAMHKARVGGDEEAHPLDEDFLGALEHGMPPTGGLGVGVDRLVMVLADAANLRETLLFPHLRPEHPKD
jgi:lysyl-tRNA synthetase class 2